MSDQEYPLTERLVLAAAQQLVQELVEKNVFHTNPFTLYNLPDFVDEERSDGQESPLKRTFTVRFRAYGRLTEEVRVAVIMNGYDLGGKRPLWVNAAVYAWHNYEKDMRIVYLRTVASFKDEVGVPDVIWGREPAYAIKMQPELMPILNVSFD